MSKREELEAKIKEQRILEATKKGLMGSSGKIGTILKFLGSEIISHQGDPGPSSFYPEYVGETDATNANDLMSRMPTMDINGNIRPETEEWGEVGESYFPETRRIGMHFDGLNRGMHMEIKYDEEKSELALTYKGFMAYKEVMGDLEVYVPNEEWEGWIEKLWSISKEIQRKIRESEFKSNAERTDANKQSWLASLVKRWGEI